MQHCSCCLHANTAAELEDVGEEGKRPDPSHTQIHIHYKIGHFALLLVVGLRWLNAVQLFLGVRPLLFFSIINSIVDAPDVRASHIDNIMDFDMENYNECQIKFASLHYSHTLWKERSIKMIDMDAKPNNNYFYFFLHFFRMTEKARQQRLGHHAAFLWPVSQLVKPLLQQPGGF